jgi:FkbM family methyltransferase
MGASLNHFFDIGANIGQSFDDFLIRTKDYDGWTVWCFEPSPRHFSGLLETAKKHAARYDIRICPFGMAEKGGFARFYEKLDPRGDSLLADFIVANKESGYSVQIATASCSDLILNHTGPQDRVLVKLDCEGSEYGILNDLLECPAALAKISRILVEWHGSELPNMEDAQRLTLRFAAIGKPLERWVV